jgi:hypothetical protein
LRFQRMVNTLRAMQVVLVFYVVLYRTTMSAAMCEVERTRAFVARIPFHILDEQVLFAPP